MFSEIDKILLVIKKKSDSIKLESIIKDSELKKSRCFFASDTAHLQELLKVHHFSLFILDIDALEGDLAKIKTIIGGGAFHAPTIVLGDSLDQGIADKAISSGAQDFILMKEISSKQLERSVSYAIQRLNYEQRLNYQNDNYRLLFDRSPTPMFIVDDATLEILKANQTARKLYGYSKKEFLGMSLLDIRFANDEQKFLDAYYKQRAGNSTYINAGVWKHRTKSGQSIYVEVALSVVNTGRRKVRLISLNDVTERYIVKKQRESLFSASMDLFYISDLKGTPLQLNPSWRSILGYSESELTSITKMIHPDDRKMTLDIIKEAVKGERNIHSFENRMLTKSGNVVYINWNASVDLENNLIVYVGRDITLRKKEEEHKRLLQSVAEHTTEGVIITNSVNTVDDRFKIVYVNDTICKSTGYSADELIGQTSRIFRGEETDHKEVLRIRKKLLKFQPVEAELVNYRKDGSKFWVHMAIVPVFDENKVATHFVSIQKDITEKKLQELKRNKQNKTLETLVKNRTRELEELNAELETFNYSVSHDMRTPLRVIDIYSGLLHKELQGSTLETYVNQIDKCTEEIGNLINGLLEFSKSGKTELKKGKVEMRSLITNVFTNQVIASKAFNAQLQVNELLDISGDEKLINIVFNNLFSNALKYSMHREYPLVKIHSERSDGYVTYYVKDNGIGFKKSESKNIFMPFVRLQNDEGYKGNGVGLAIVDRIIKRHGGVIKAEGEPGKGARFEIKFPV